MFDTRRMAMVAVALMAAARAAGGDEPAAPAGPEPVLRSIAEIHALPTERLAAGVEARFRGVVTSLEKTYVGMSLSVQEGGFATWVVVPSALAPAGLVAGAEIEAEGIVRRRLFAPALDARRIVVVGHGPMPEPVPADFARLSRGLDNALLLEVTGIVQHVAEDGRDGGLVVKCDAWTVPVRLMFHGGLDLLGLLDARVRVVGRNGAVRNPRGELLTVSVSVQSPDDVTVVEPPRSEPFAAPEVPLDAIAWFNALPYDGHRFLSRGTVTALATDGSLYLQRGRTGVRVETVRSAGVASGDEVEVAGFLDTRRGVAGICGALVRKTASGPRPEPLAITADEILDLYRNLNGGGKALGPDDYAGCLVRFPATLIDRIATHEGGTLVLASGSSTVTALLPQEAYDAVRSVEAGSRVEITGIVDIAFSDDTYEQGFGQLHDWRPARVDRFSLLVTRADDVVVTQPPPWWTPRRLAIALGATGVAIGGALAWVALLRRQVKVKSAQLAAEAQDRQAAAIEFDATLRERSRLAANLHDTVLQTVTGIGYQLQVCRAEDTRQGRDGPRRLDVAQRMVDHAIDQLRGTVWALHALPDDGSSLARALEARLAALRQGRATPIRCSVAGDERPVAPEVQANLLLVAQEAVVNALRHAAAGAIDVSLIYAPDDTVTVTVRDDGRGFRMSDRPGALEGHFGIEGMIDRMLAVAGECTITTRPGEGTTVVAAAPVAGSLSCRTGAEWAGNGPMT